MNREKRIQELSTAIERAINDLDRIELGEGVEINARQIRERLEEVLEKDGS